MSFWLKIADTFSRKGLSYHDVQPVGDPPIPGVHDTCYEYLPIEHDEYTCSKCKWDSECEFAYDPYNTGGDCLQDK